MSGVEILAVKEVVVSRGFNIEVFFITFIITFALILFISVIVMLVDSDPEIMILASLFGMVFGLFFGYMAGTIYAEPDEYRNEYKVIVSDEVSINDFFEKYELIDCEENIYTVVEKDNK